MVANLKPDEKLDGCPCPLTAWTGLEFSFPQMVFV